MTVIKK